MDDILSGLSEDQYKKARGQMLAFYEMYDVTEKLCKMRYRYDVHPHQGMTREEVSNIISTFDKDLREILLRMYDGKDYSDLIWKGIQPNEDSYGK